MSVLASAKPAITKGSYVRHKIHTHRGLGKVLEVGPTYVPHQTPKLNVGWHHGGPLWCFPDDLLVVPCAIEPEAKPTLTVVEHPPVVA